jgi:hypothetical protein
MSKQRDAALKLERDGWKFYKYTNLPIYSVMRKRSLYRAAIYPDGSIGYSKLSNGKWELCDGISS